MADIDIIQEALGHAKLKRDSILSFNRLAVGQRISFHKDITSLSILLLGGVVALFNLTDPKLVKTSWLLYVAGGFFVVASALSTYVRIKLIEHLQGVAGAIELWLANVGARVKELRGLIVQNNPSDSDKAVAIHNLIEAEKPTNLPQLSRIADQGHEWAAGLFFTGIVMIALSLLIHIT